ncbi:ankyrin repeat domain-containing protein SOWAHB [Colius striatus]|uniref:ankyrin repeat domain-containing protein SOWAHB n=1 Tax=Colius striatus TaxID=57412 RepID=UPI002B1D4955|nr:ankyrin repeat domain-containing protein SOWAHB [Colius striatus]
MARELSQEAVLDFLWGAGGRAPNAALLRHFQRFLRDPALTEQQRRERREYFKSLVNSLATVHPAAVPGASKDIVLRRRYRDLLDEELPPPPPPEEQRDEEKQEPPPSRRDPDRRRGPHGEAAAKGRPGGGEPPGAAVARGCAARGRGGPCCECRRARRAAAAPPPVPGPPSPAGPPRSRSPPPPPAQPPPYRTQPLSSGAWTLHPAGTPRSWTPVLPSGPGALNPAGPFPSRSPLPLPAEPPPYETLQPPSARPSRSPSPPLPPKPGVLPSAGSAPVGSLPPQRPRGPPPTQSPALPSGPGVSAPDCLRLSQPRFPPQPHRRMPLLKALPPSAGPGGRPLLGPSQSASLSSGPRALSPHELPLSRPRQPPLAEPPRSQSMLLLSAPGVLPLSRSLQELPSSPSSSTPRLSGPDALPSTGLHSAQSTSLQQLPTKPSSSPSLPKGCRGLTTNRSTQSQILLPYPRQTLPLPSGPGVLSPTQPSPSQSLHQSPNRPLSSQSQQPASARSPSSQSLLPAQQGNRSQAPESSSSASLPVFKSIRCQLALLEVQSIPPSLTNDCGRQSRTVSSKRTSPRNVPNRGLSVPLGRREHAWLVAVSEGRWARVRGLFLEEPELALQRDFMSGFTVLHWLAKHGDGPGLQELATAARQAGLALDVDARSGCGYTPLHLAAIHGHQLVIKVLVLQLGCKVQVRDSSGRRPWEYLGSSTSGEIWQLLEAPRGTIMFPTQPLAHSVSSVSKVSLSHGRAALPTCLRPQHGRGAASHRTSGKSH